MCNKKKLEEYLLQLTKNNTQLMFNHLFDLPKQTTEKGEMISLPLPVLRLPREKHIPKIKPKTKWEQFADTKGIKNRKRSRMVYDEINEEWRPRYGYKRVQTAEDDWVLEHKGDGSDDHVNLFDKRKMEKKERIIKNQLQHIKNIERAKGKEKKELVPSGIPQTIHETKHGLMRGRKGTKVAIDQVVKSTASMGKFNPGQKKKKFPSKKK